MGCLEHNISKSDIKLLSDKFCQALAKLKLDVAWEVALEIDKRQFWLALSNKAMDLLNIELTCKIYRQLGDAGMVMALRECQHIEDKNLLAGHMSMLFNDYDVAQELFLESQRPSAALDMRRDLMHWDQALDLAQALAIEDVPDICCQFARSLEMKGETSKALEKYDYAEAALEDMADADEIPAVSSLIATRSTTRECSVKATEYNYDHGYTIKE